MRFLEDLSLTNWSAQLVVYGAGVLAAGIVGWLLLHHRAPRRSVSIAVVAGGLPLLAKVLIEQVWRPFPDALPWTVYAFFGVLVACVMALALFQRRALAAVATTLALVGGLGAVNCAYHVYPSVGALVPGQYAKEMNYGQFVDQQRANALPTDQGVRVTVSLAGKASGFQARNAEVYLPPAYWQHPQQQLPVMVLMAGNPGTPGDWFDSASLARTLDDYQKAHHGVTPIVASVDATGSYTANPICVDSAEHKVQTYLSKDVPADLEASFRVQPDQRRWTIGGLSYGGTCSLQVVANHPDAYGNFLDFSGQEEPTIGQHDDTVRKFFGGDEQAFQRVNPATLLAQAAGKHTYAGIQGKFIAGERDKESQRALGHLNDLARGAGMRTDFHTVHGGHDFSTWRTGIAEYLPWAAERGGLR